MRPSIETLAALALFTGFSEAHLAVVEKMSELARVGPDEMLLRPNHSPSHVIILLAGLVAETRTHATDETITDILLPVVPLGFAPALLQAPSQTGATTVTAARLIFIPAPELRAMLRAEPSLALPLLDHALGRMQVMSREVGQLKLRSAAQRLADYLLSLAEGSDMTPARFVLPYEKRLLAAKIGCSQENLSRAFAALRRLGVETQRGIVVLRDVAGLRAFAALQHHGGLRA